MVFKNEDAVSGVIGEMLMLSITVMIVSVLITSIHVLSSDDRTPFVDIKIEYDQASSNITLRHEGGDSVSKNYLRVTIDNGTGKNSTMELHELENGIWKFGDSVTIHTDLTSPPLYVTVVYQNSVLSRQQVV